jgi:hypothetical protein
MVKFRVEAPQIFGAILKIYSIGSPEALDFYKAALRYTE